MAKAVVVEVNSTRDRGDGQLIDLDVTLADGNRQVIAFAYAKVARYSTPQVSALARKSFDIVFFRA